MQYAGVHILRSKLRPPQLKNAVPRPRLIDRLLDKSDRRIVVIEADAGYGKTTLAAQFLEVSGARPIWYRLDESDASVPVFLTYLVASLRPVPGDETAVFPMEEGWLELASADAERATTALVARLEELIDSPAILVLDDYHNVNDAKPLRRALQVLLRNMPENLKVMLLTRVTPALNLARMTAAGDVLWLSSADLEFSESETRALWEVQGLPDHGRGGALAKAHGLTRGWAAGLVLLSDWLRRGGRVDEAALDAFVTQREVYDYLAEEVFDRQPERVKQFLLDTCVLEEIGEREASLLAGVDRPTVLLARVERESLFFRRKEGHSLSYSCHPLFLRFLQQRLEQEQGGAALGELHTRAARLYGDMGDMDRAVRHVLSSADGRLLDELGRQHAAGIVHGHRPDLAERLIRECQDPSSHPWATVLLGYVFHCRGESKRALVVLRRAVDEARVLGESQMRCLALELLSLVHISLGEYEQASRTCEVALGALSDSQEPLFAGTNLHLMMGCCRALAGDMVGALRAGERGIADLDSHSISQQAVTLARHALLLVWAGDFACARAYGNRALELTTAGGAQLYAAWIADICAEVAAESGEYVIAQTCIREAIRHTAQSSYSPEDWMVTRGMQGYLLSGLGDTQTATVALRECADTASNRDDRQVETEATAHLSSCARTDESFAEAVALGSKAVAQAPYGDVRLALLARLSHAAALVACNDLNAAAAELCDIAKITRRPGFGRSEAWCRWLRADIARRKGRMHHCDQHLRKALSIARENRYVHLMIIEGRITPELLIRALETEVETDFACEILSRIGPWLLPHAKALLASDDAQLALLGIRALGDTGRSWARGPLLDAVRHKDPQVSKAAAEALARLPVQQEEKLRVTAFGNFTVLCGDREVMWRKRKAKYLLEYLFINRKRRIPKDVIVDAFWPDSSLQAAVNNFYVTFHALKRSLNPHLQRREQLPYFATDDNMFQLVAETFSSDVDDFLDAVSKATQYESEGKTDEAIGSLRRCQKLYAGDLMEDSLYEDWAAQERQELKETYFDAMRSLAGLLDSKGEHEEAARVLRRLVSKDKTREDLHLLAAEQYVKLGNRALAVTQLKLCERALREELGVEISSDIRRAFETLLSAESVSSPLSAEKAPL